MASHKESSPPPYSFKASFSQHLKHFKESSFGGASDSKNREMNSVDSADGSSISNNSNQNTNNSNHPVSSHVDHSMGQILPPDDGLPPLAPIKLSGYKTTTHHRLLTPELAEEIRNLIGARLQLYSEWNLLYSLEQHGASLNTLYTRVSPTFHDPGSRNVDIRSLNQTYNYSTIHRTYTSNHQKKTGYVIIVRDREGNIFGAYSNEHFRPSEAHERFYGNGECFLWRCVKTNVFEINHEKGTNTVKRRLSYNDTNSGEEVEKGKSKEMVKSMNGNKLEGLKEGEMHKPLLDHPLNNKGENNSVTHLQFKAFLYTGLNDFIIHCGRDFLSMGVSGGHYGLWMDGGLINGVSYKTMTFGNEPLSGMGEKFVISGVEVWKVG
ncbi:Oxr1 protein [Saccharomycopsis crataegensis]|uniref:Oxidation resistance protein 1 n=1 Tax=Saccharomycopsis crataegensis TaxID=43959 RepID=A0AAV5QQY6_9ASCO|nr:Oxr1 protein [Saccharomycopsis crataegensis]